MRFMLFYCKNFKQRKEIFHGIKAAHLSVIRQVEFCACHSERS